MKKSILFTVFFILQSLIFNLQSFAQCAMCRAVVESNQAGGGGVGAGLNTGILYLMALPYIFIFGGLYFWYRYKRLASQNE